MSLFLYFLSIISLLSSVISLAVSPGFHQDVFFLSSSLPLRPLFSRLTMFFFSSLSYSLTFLSQRLLLSLSESLYHHRLCLPPRSSHTLTCAHLYTQWLIHIPPVSVSLELSEGIKSTFKIHLFILSYSLSDSRSYSFLYSSPIAAPALWVNVMICAHIYAWDFCWLHTCARTHTKAQHK